MNIIEAKIVDVKKSRFRDAPWFEKIDSLQTPIVMGGIGGIGSWLSLFISRITRSNHTLVMYDHDTIEETNMAGQLFPMDSYGKHKATVANGQMWSFSGSTDVHGITTRFTDSAFVSEIMFSCFDNMEARKIMFKEWRKCAEKSNVPAIFIDGRLLAEQFQVFFVTLERADEYEEKHLFDDSEVEDANCSYKQTSHFAASVAAKMVQGFTNWLAGGTSVCPFYYEEIGDIFYSKADD